MMKKRRKIRKTRVATGVFDEDFSTGSHGQVGPPMAFSRMHQDDAFRRDAPIPPMPNTYFVGKKQIESFAPPDSGGPTDNLADINV